MKQLKIYSGGIYAGLLTQHSLEDYEFTYDAAYVASGNSPVSLTLPVRAESYHSAYLFPFFFNMLPEGANRRTVCSLCRIDENDHFSLLAQYAGMDIIGDISIERVWPRE